ncbi:hypothetical protein L596_008386 [Steinernema carpocapsae]|uniref:EIPR1-like beta-propeller domain-containing protein n=1 Tax=Steinernema carpocapsae TaxID=34508 RepID=A0A4U5PCU9_STECR|nr:hypothetical protein L596_008386 [Steinernema carpocapsae]
METPLMCGIDLPARTIVSVAREEATQFIVGSLGLKAENQLVLLEIDEEFSQISNTAFPHLSGEVWALASHPTQPDIVSTCFLSSDAAGNLACGAKLWKMQGDRLEKLAAFDLPKETKRADSMHFSRDGTKAGISLDHAFSLFSIDEADVQLVKLHNLEEKKLSSFAWNPHSNGVALAIDNSVVFMDVRSFGTQNVISDAHFSRVRQVDFNPNMANVIVTAGDDSASIWDLRKSSKPLHTINDHLHWVWNARYNPIHDQLLLTTSSDTKVYLHCVGSLSSEATQEEEGVERLPDGRLDSVEDHEESVYGCAWSSNDPWIYASLSYDGRVIFSRVKREHKYRILQI